ncbi:MAG: type II toxin-antitoxin system HipA family toxin, partial [Vogesella sp.]|uniref:type II toxin-antitoxin system HipA family toxin n=1 Tax=Vogesella sp. TaxID=1904252 RepID=UPI003F3555C9
RLGKIHALLLRRFDRPGKVDSGGRIHFLSAAAFTNSPYDSNAGSYVKLAQHLRKYGANVAADLAQLFRRMVFNMAIDNTDDHVKNHGVLHAGSNRYGLSPAYDLVPQLTNLGYMSMAIVDEKMDAHLDLARANAAQFGLTKEAAHQIISEVLQGVSNWRSLFESMGVDRPALSRIEACLTRQMQMINQ